MNKQHTAFCPDGQPHHWRIAPNRRRYSMGTCRRCGEQRQFDNVPHAPTWNEGSKRLAAQRRAARLAEDA